MSNSGQDTLGNAESNAEKARQGITVYTTKWCGACWFAKRFLKSRQIEFTEVDISKDAQAMELVMRLNNGYRSVPTIIFPDGSHLTEPRQHELEDKLALLEQ